MEHGQPVSLMRLKVTLILLLITQMAACGEDPAPPPDYGVVADGKLEFVHADSSVIHSIDIEIADTEAKRQRGLMNRRGIGLNEGMLFIFPKPDTLSFWMRNTAIPLDIIFVDPDLDIVNIAHRTTPLSDDYIRAHALAQYVVEVRGGVSERYGITDSASVRWQKKPD